LALANYKTHISSNQQTLKKMNRKNGIDLFRLIAAFMIVYLHAESYGSINEEYVNNIRIFSRWALPFFFITTGYFLENKIKNNNTLSFNEIENNIITLISILIISSIIYLTLDSLTGIFLLEVNNILIGTYFHLWFIGSLLFGYIFTWYLFYIKMSKLLPYISAFVLAFALFIDTYDQVLHKNFDFRLGRFLLSIPFMYIGIIISNKKNRILSNTVLVALVLVGLIIQFTEASLFFKFYNYDKNLHQFLFGTIITVVPLFILSTRIVVKENLFSLWGKKHSLFIYLYHPVILYVLIPKTIKKIIPNYYDFIQIISPIIGFALPLLTAIVLDSFFPKVYAILNGKFINKNS
jgi:surface polysaccharide O-acyltransferase-like enzyme